MRKRMLAFLLTAMMLLSEFPVEAAQSESVQESVLVAAKVDSNTEQEPKDEESSYENIIEEFPAISEEEQDAFYNVELPREPESEMQPDGTPIEPPPSNMEVPELPMEPEAIVEVPKEEEKKDSESKEMVQAPQESVESNIQQENIYPLGGFQLPQEIEISSKTANGIKLPLEDRKSAQNGQIQWYFTTYGSQKYDSSWDIYSSNYIYNQLNNKERKFWDMMDELGRKYLTTTVDATLVNYSDGSAYVIGEINYGTLGLSITQVRSLYLMFTYSNPQYYFLGNGYLFETYKNTVYPIIYDDFVKGTVRKNKTAKVKTQIDSMTNKIKKGANDVEKARIAHDLTIEKVLYDPGFAMGSSRPFTPFHQSAYSVFCDDYTVCAGYTKAFEILMNGVGIDTFGITSITHAWNMICLNDSWYCMDLTWDDLDGKYGMSKQYTYFGVSESRLIGELDRQKSHEKESMYHGFTPKSSKDFGSTVTQVGVAYMPSEVSATPVIKQKKTKDGVSVTLKSDTEDAIIYYTLDGKEPSASFTRSYQYQGAFRITDNVTVKAVAISDGKWDSEISSQTVKGKMYTVKFDAMGGKKSSSQKIWPGEQLKKPSDPQRKNYKFAGWYKEKNYKNKWNFKNKVTKNITVYAKWTKVKVADTSITNVKNLSGRKIQVSVKKISGAKGYQVRYSTNSNMKSAKKVSSNSTKISMSKLKIGTLYYVQARAYTKDSAGNKIYGSWSKTKSAFVKK